MGQALAVGGIAGVVGQIGAAQGLAVRTKLRIVAHCHDQVPVAGRKHLIGHNVLVGIARTPGCHTRGHVIQVLVGQHGYMAIEQGHIDMLPQAAAIALVQRPQNGHCGIHAGEQIGNRHAGFLRSAPRQVIAFTRNAHETAQALNHEVVAGQRRHRAGLTKTGNGTVDQFRVNGLDAFIIKTVFFQTAHFEVFHQYIAAARHFAHQRGAFRRGNIDGNRTLVAVGAQVVGSFAGVVAAGVFQIGRAPAARVVARARPLYLVNVSAQIGQVLRTPWPGQHTG